MRTLDQILTKKDYSRKTPASLFYIRTARCGKNC